MGFMWNEVAPNDHYFLRVEKTISPYELVSVTQLYQPLIGPLSTSLYITLYHEWSVETTAAATNNHRGLMSALGAPLHEIVKARQNLEAVGLLRTMKVEGEEDGDLYYEYELLPPLSPSRFFADDLLNIILLNKVGKQTYGQLRKKLLGKKRSPISNGARSELTKSFDEVFRSIAPSELIVAPGSETERFLAEFEERYPADSHPEATEKKERRLKLTESEPDFEFLEASLPKTGIKRRKLDAEARQTIKELAFLYGLDDLLLSYFLQDPYVYGDDDELKPDRLRKVAKEWYLREHRGHPEVVRRPSPDSGPADPTEAQAELSREEAHKRALSTVSPVTLIEQYQDGAKVSPADLRIVEELSESYRLPFGVVNVLLEYVMLTNNKQLPRSLIFKIASHWKRLKIDSVEDALEQAKQLYREAKQSRAKKAPTSPTQTARKRTPSKENARPDVPEWVARQDEIAPTKTELDEEQKRQAERLLRALGELDS